MSRALFRRSLQVHLVVCMSRKHNVHALHTRKNNVHALCTEYIDTVDRRGYCGLQNCDACRPCSLIWSQFFARFDWLTHMSCLDAYISRYDDLCAHDDDHTTALACTYSNNVRYPIESLSYTYILKSLYGSTCELDGNKINHLMKSHKITSQHMCHSVAWLCEAYYHIITILIRIKTAPRLVSAHGVLRNI